jgi:hypothetical protein
MSEPPTTPNPGFNSPDGFTPPDGQGVSIDIQDVIDDMKSQISELNYQNMLLRLTIKKFQ